MGYYFISDVNINGDAYDSEEEISLELQEECHGIAVYVLNK